MYVIYACFSDVYLRVFQVLCIMYEYTKEEKRSWRKACQVTVQKLLYVLVVCATAVRGAYFFTKVNRSLPPGVFFSFLLFFT